MICSNRHQQTVEGPAAPTEKTRLGRPKETQVRLAPLCPPRVRPEIPNPSFLMTAKSLRRERKRKEVTKR